MRDSFRLEFWYSFVEAGNQYKTSPVAAGVVLFHGTMYTGAFEPPPPPPLLAMPPPPPPPPPPHVANDVCTKNMARRATAIERKICVFIARDYIGRQYLNQ